ncbi:hypothetical protein BMS3Bbin01_00359 [bacterium BMS3Bbin01]|nr:hypothetical protein BMS3Bbin01_00359 [bacterium BMS3Bbin01]
MVTERLGHENVAFTLKQYAHVLPGMQADAARLITTAVLDDENDIDEEDHPTETDEADQENDEKSDST